MKSRENIRFEMQIIEAHALNVHFYATLPRGTKIKTEDFSECLFSVENLLIAVVEVGISSLQILVIASSVGIAGNNVLGARAGRVVEHSRMDSQIHVQFGTKKLSR